ncbi:DUF4359 domain-containing protein [Fictibacillus nanhaiensis]|uniref:DUF4359 domain-containing protein n=1 Tax=Fictibacillus nanhaiensis TaxID=742169 RepID=UPI001C937EAA|nr:DUF4359 domain-containing protein [Fictibacillus nanhaiensis]MBY6038299.1 DUF4359 domain-containing protein [Fictibacillus nanhaiensis]
MKKKWFMIGLLLVITAILVITNPSEKDYEAVFLTEMEKSDKNLKKYYKLERIDFYFFSTYTTFIANENGITHLGILGQFFRISDGQFDYPKWLELFH